jgi:hypothetical protein
VFRFTTVATAPPESTPPPELLPPVQQIPAQPQPEPEKERRIFNLIYLTLKPKCFQSSSFCYSHFFIFDVSKLLSILNTLCCTVNILFLSDEIIITKSRCIAVFDRINKDSFYNQLN